MIVAETVGLGRIVIDGEDIYWIETRPAEGGRCVIVRRSPDGRIADVTPPSFNARTLVHEYGGGSFVVTDGTIYFSNFTDQRLYRQIPVQSHSQSPLRRICAMPMVSLITAGGA